MSKPKKGGVVVLAGTRKGGFVFSSDARRKSWSVEGPHFAGLSVHHFILDPRAPGGVRPASSHSRTNRVEFLGW